MIYKEYSLEGKFWIREQIGSLLAQLARYERDIK